MYLCVYFSVRPQRAMSSEEEVDPSEMYEDMALAPTEGSNVLRTPILELTGHSGVVIAADWLAGAEQVRRRRLERSEGVGGGVGRGGWGCWNS